MPLLPIVLLHYPTLNLGISPRLVNIIESNSSEKRKDEHIESNKTVNSMKECDVHCCAESNSSGSSWFITGCTCCIVKFLLLRDIAS
jgi:hypothetical protein